MLSQIATLLGGLGLVLLGMALLSEGLSQAAGRALRGFLNRATRTVPSAILSGTLVTALLQSSSATTLMTIGFVSVGVLSFKQALGVIFGANVGTTATAWIVSLVGLKIKIDAFALPAVGLGALLRVFSRGRVAHIGGALAGFGLVFLGIELLQQSMGSMGELFDLSSFDAEGWGGRLLLVGVGVVMTVIMQSSSAAVAATLAALAAGTLNVEQAAALVIGQNVGTTATAWLGAAGSSLAARRTAAAHSLFNVLTGVVAFLLVPLFVVGMGALERRWGGLDGATTIALFHTAFNLLGVAMISPFSGPFARLIERILPSSSAPFVWRLDEGAAGVGELALEALHHTAQDLAGHMLDLLVEALEGQRDPDTLERHLRDVGPALNACRAYLNKVHISSQEAHLREQLIALSHVFDHLQRTLHTAQEVEHFVVLGEVERLGPPRALLLRELARASASLAPKQDARAAVAEIGVLSRELAQLRAAVRRDLLDDAADPATPPLPPEQLTAALAALHWLDRLGYHTWRWTHHLSGEVEWREEGS